MAARLEPYPYFLQPPIIQSPTKNPTWADIVNKNHGNLCGDLLTPTVTFAGWTTDPINLTNLHDGSRTTVTGEALETALPGPNETDGDAEFKIDLGALYHVDAVYVKHEGRALGPGTPSIRIRAGPLGDLTDSLLATETSISTVPKIIHSHSTYPDLLATADSFVRYVALRGFNPGGTGSSLGLKVYEVIIIGDRRAT